MWRAILVSLLAQGLTADKISYDGSASFVQSSSTSHHQQQHQQQWSWQDPGKDLLAAADTVQGEAFHPVTFEAPDALKQGHQQNDLQNAATAYQSQQYNANVQQDGSGVAQAFDQAIQSVDTVIDDILVSNRQGRNLEGYDEVYSDPNVKNALRLGNDTVARAYIRDKLCSLGLMNCDDPEGRRPYYSPHRDIQPQEIIYAQPVTIKPVGRPLPAIPVKRPYGPPRPVPVPPGFGSGPPGPIYSGSSGPFSKPPPFSGPPPSFSGPSYGHPPSFSGPYPGFKKPGPIYDSKPVYEGGSSSFEGELDYEDKYIEKKQVILHQGHDSGVQQHVHHHYHHGEEHNGGGKAPTVVVNNPGLVPGGSGPVIGPGPIGVNGFNNYGYGNGGSYGSGGSYGGSYNDHFDQSFKKEFKIKTPSSGNSLLGAASNSYAERYPSYEKPRPDTAVFGSGNSNKGGSSFSNNYDSGKQFNSGFSNSQYDSVSSSNGFGSNGNRYGSNDFGGNGNGNYASGNGNGFGSVNNYGSSNGFDNGFSSSNNDDCVCVPYEQCPTVDQLGRKDDLYLALDPRNLNKNIEAETVEVVLTDGNGNMSVVRVPKGVNVSEEAEHKKEEDNKSTENGDKADKDKVSDGSTDKVDAKRSKRDVKQVDGDKAKKTDAQGRQFGRPQVCGPRHVCCRRPQINNQRPSRNGQCGVRNSQGINGRIKTPVYVDGDSEFGEYPWQVAILKKDPSESVYVCGGTLISPRHILTAAHCIKTHSGRDLRARLGEWDVNHDVEFFPYIERDIVSVVVHPEFYAGTLYNDIAILKLDHDIDFERNPHISPACLPNKHDDFNGVRCWTTGWGKDAFGDFGKYQNILKEVDVPVISNGVCENQMRKTRLGYSFNLHPGFICAGGEEGKDACKGDGGGPMVCERQGRWQLAGVVSWGIGCGQAGVPGVYARVSHYLDWIRQVTGQN
ncbi:uncharacterized protein LOC105687940 isoform X3 [Athalia rosae]|uniref:uncharacterized protein LOC105687940 isoform X3 n=1 Tax=Athalia rosae TaxID=37344 RepID=UPI002033A441|nr:uncharacterized protein LOC105687940 isoform X3 [Athalia rosae]